MKYLSSCIPGLQGVAGELIRKQGGNILDMGEGIVLYSSKSEPSFSFVNNTFLVLAQIKRAKNAEDILAKIYADGSWLDKLPTRGTFRVVTQDSGGLVSVNKRLLSDVEEVISASTGMKVSRRGAEAELWALSRDGQGYFLLRLTKHKSYDKLLHKGELRPDLCELMIEMAGVRKGDTVLDPFCGYGAIPKALLKRDVKVIAGDIDNSLISPVPTWARHAGKKLELRRMDVLSLPFSANFVDIIITDPPWGEYNSYNHKPLAEHDIVTSFKRVIKPGGKIVLLASRDSSFKRAFMSAGFSPERLEVLISGKKATIFIA